MIDIQIDTKGVEQALSQTAKGVKSIQKQTVGIIAKGYVKEIKRQITATGIKKISGELYKAYRYKVKGDVATIYPKSQTPGKKANTLIMAKAGTLNYGNTISVRKGRKFLQVSGSGYWARPKRVSIRGRDFLGRAENLYINNERYNADVEKMVEKQLKKYWG